MQFHAGFLLLVMVCETLGWSWTARNIKGPRVSGHVACNLAGSGSDKVFLFGGLTGPAGSPVTDELYCYDNNDGTWEKLDTIAKGPRPGRRMYSASAILDGSLYLFGGWDPGEPKSGGTFLDDVWRLDLATMQWSKDEATPMPFGPVSRHTACRVGNMIVVHTFRGVLVLNKNAGGNLFEQPTTGEAPDGLSMCAVAPLGEDAMLLFGGSTKTQALSADAFVLDTNTWIWRKLKCTNSADDGDDTRPCARAAACAAPVDASNCVIFGGAHLGEGGYGGGAGLMAQDDTWVVTVQGDEAKWNKVAITSGNSGPEARIAATLTAFGSGTFLLQGGYDPVSKGTYETPWLLTP